MTARRPNGPATHRGDRSSLDRKDGSKRQLRLVAIQDGWPSEEMVDAYDDAFALNGAWASLPRTPAPTGRDGEPALLTRIQR